MNNIEKIENYEMGKLKGEDLLNFKKSLESDASLAEDLYLYRQIQKSMMQKGKNQLYNTLQQIHQENQPRGIVRKLGYYRIAAVAAAVTILIAVGALLLTMFSSPTNEQLYATYFQPENSILNIRSEGIDLEQTVVLGMQLYEMQQFGAAIEMFNMVPSNLLAKLYGGIAFMELGSYEKAIDNFNYIIKHDDNLFIDQAEWYLSLSYLKTNQIDKAKTTLLNIVKENTKYKTQSLSLLNDLEKRN
jgi:tetratricopeptide (TPR) repeat protein